MAHTLILGMTMSGKSTLAKYYSQEFKSRGVGVLVLDTMSDPGWCADYVTRDKSQFIKTAKINKKCALFIDEGGQEIGRYAKESAWLATQSRHWGHKSFFISQRASQIDKTVRDQCSSLFCFRVSKKDAEILAEEFAQDELLSCATLDKLHFVRTGRFETPRFGKLRFEKNGKILLEYLDGKE